MARFLGRRFVYSIGVLLATSIIVFGLSRVAGDPRHLFLTEYTTTETRGCLGPGIRARPPIHRPVRHLDEQGLEGRFRYLTQGPHQRSACYPGTYTRNPATNDCLFHRRDTDWSAAWRAFSRKTGNDLGLCRPDLGIAWPGPAALLAGRNDGSAVRGTAGLVAVG